MNNFTITGVLKATLNTVDNSFARGEPMWEASFLRWYNILMMIGFILSFLTVAFYWRRMKYKWETLQIITIILIPSSIIGARLWYVLSEGGWTHFFAFSGLSIHGGVMGAMIGTLPYAWVKRDEIDFRTAFQFVVPAILIGQAIGRWGNFTNHEVYGSSIKEGDSLWWTLSWLPKGIQDHMYIQDIGDPAYRVPLFFYESVLNFIGYILIAWVFNFRNTFKPGTTVGIYFVWYGLTRAIMEPMRDPIDIMRWGTMSISYATSIVSIISGIILIAYYNIFSSPRIGISKKMLKLAVIKRNNLIYKMSVHYQVIKPLKPRKKWFLFGKKIEVPVKLYIPIENVTIIDDFVASGGNENDLPLELTETQIDRIKKIKETGLSNSYDDENEVSENMNEGVVKIAQTDENENKGDIDGK